MTISVVIATYERAVMLDNCLAHLSTQRFEGGDEVIVVDNGSIDATALVVQRHQSSFPVPLHSLRESRPGKAHALARAQLAASGDILAFTDDDVTVHDAWLQEVRAAMTCDESVEGDVALVGGPVAPQFEARTPRWLRFEEDEYGRLAAPLALLNYGCRPIELGPRTLLGANLAIRRDVLEQIGGFATHLGKLRGTLLSGEDEDVCRRVQMAGFKALYHPTIRVLHRVPAARMRLAYFLDWFFWSGITASVIDRRDGLASRPPLRPAYLLRRFFAGVCGALAAGARGRFTNAVDYSVDAAFAAGYAAQCWGLVSVEGSIPVPAGDPA